MKCVLYLTVFCLCLMTCVNAAVQDEICRKITDAKSCGEMSGCAPFYWGTKPDETPGTYGGCGNAFSCNSTLWKNRCVKELKPQGMTRFVSSGCPIVGLFAEYPCNGKATDIPILFSGSLDILVPSEIIPGVGVEWAVFTRNDSYRNGYNGEQYLEFTVTGRVPTAQISFNITSPDGTKNTPTVLKTYGLMESSSPSAVQYVQLLGNPPVLGVNQKKKFGYILKGSWQANKLDFTSFAIRLPRPTNSTPAIYGTPSSLPPRLQIALSNYDETSFTSSMMTLLNISSPDDYVFKATKITSSAVSAEFYLVDIRMINNEMVDQFAYLATMKPQYLAEALLPLLNYQVFASENLFDRTTYCASMSESSCKDLSTVFDTAICRPFYYKPASGGDQVYGGCSYAASCSTRASESYCVKKLGKVTDDILYVASGCAPFGQYATVNCNTTSVPSNILPSTVTTKSLTLPSATVKFTSFVRSVRNNPLYAVMTVLNFELVASGNISRVSLSLPSSFDCKNPSKLREPPVIALWGISRFNISGNSDVMLYGNPQRLNQGMTKTFGVALAGDWSKCYAGVSEASLNIQTSPSNATATIVYYPRIRVRTTSRDYNAFVASLQKLLNIASSDVIFRGYENPTNTSSGFSTLNIRMNATNTERLDSMVSSGDPAVAYSGLQLASLSVDYSDATLESQESDDSGLSTGAKIGIAVAVSVVGLLIIVVIVVVVTRKNSGASYV